MKNSLSRRRFSLTNENLAFLTRISEEAGLTCSEFLEELLDKMQNSPAPVNGWLTEAS